MKVKTLLKTLDNVEYTLVAESGWTHENGFRSTWEYENKSVCSGFENFDVVKITTNEHSGRLFITIK